MHLVSIEYQGGRFRACKGRKTCFVEARADVAKAIVTACLDRTEKEIMDATNKMMRSKPKDGCQPKRNAAPEGCQPKRDAAAEGCQPTDAKTIGFSVAQSTYEVRYVAADGTKKRTVKGLKVPTSDNKGKPLSPDEHDENLRRVHRAARAMWNELDKSGEPRFPLD